MIAYFEGKQHVKGLVLMLKICHHGLGCKEACSKMSPKVTQNNNGLVRLHPGEVVAKNLNRYVPPGLSKIGSPELIFGLKLGSPEQIFAKMYVSGAKNRQDWS